jgi:hypothetical protein
MLSAVGLNRTSQAHTHHILARCCRMADFQNEYRIAISVQHPPHRTDRRCHAANFLLDRSYAFWPALEGRRHAPALVDKAPAFGRLDDPDGGRAGLWC